MSQILSVSITGRSYQETVAKCMEWAKLGESRAVFFANVHMLMEGFDDPLFRASLNHADLVNPDGVPLVWALRALGQRDLARVYGPDTTELLLTAASNAGVPVGFYGGAEAALGRLLATVKSRYPSLKVAFAMSPPFRALSQLEDETIGEQIRASGARLLFVGLGCPKQERWIMAHRGNLPVVMLAVGAAFDFLSNSKSQAPRWMMRSGLEWAFRLASEPRRLAGRYFIHNPRFVALFLHQWMMSIVQK